MPMMADVFAILARRTKVAVPVAEVASRLGVGRDDARRAGELEVAILGLEAAGLAHLWDAPGDHASGRAGPVLTLSAASAERLGLRLNSESSRWMAKGGRERPERTRCQVLADGRVILCDTDTTEEPPGSLHNIPAKEADTDPSPITRKAMAEERRLGLVRPTLAICGVRPFPVAGQSTAPLGPAYLAACGVDARGMDGDDALKAGNYGRNPGRTSGGCGLCEERRLGALTTLLPPRAKKMGKHPAVRPARVVDGGELCCACNRHWQDATWPVVRRLPDDARPARPAAPEPEKAASRKERRAANGGKKSA